eukprot:COSAG06_NODE_17826_length_919_cov_1.267073_1_plen_157_part_01
MADDGSASRAATTGDEVEGLLPESTDRPVEPSVQPGGHAAGGAPNAEETAEGGAQTPGATRKILVQPVDDRKENEEGSGQGAPQDGDDQAPEPEPGDDDDSPGVLDTIKTGVAGVLKGTFSQSANENANQEEEGKEQEEEEEESRTKMLYRIVATLG